MRKQLYFASPCTRIARMKLFMGRESKSFIEIILIFNCFEAKRKKNS